MTRKQAAPFFCIILASFVVIFGNQLFTKGLFVDSVFYGCLAQNLHEGFGNWWDLSVTQHYQDVFVGHPPLGVWMLSGLMDWLGTPFWIERFFALLCLFFLLFGMAKVWQLVYPKSSILSTWWLWFLWGTILVNIWSFQQNLLDNVMVVFIIGTVYWSIKSIRDQHIVSSIIAGLFLFLATFSKGPVGLFPLITIGAYWLAFRNVRLREAIFLNLVVLLTVLCSYLLLLYNSSDAQHYFEAYFREQLVRSFSDNSLAIRGRFYILKLMLLEPVVLWILFLGIFYQYKRQKQTVPKPIGQWSIFFLLLFLAGTLPMLVSPKQMRFYIVPALPFVALSIGVFTYPWIEKQVQTWIQKGKRARLLYFLSTLLLVVGVYLSYYNYGRYSRDEALIKDIESVCTVIPPKAKILLKEAVTNHAARCYFMRMHHVGVHQYKWQKSKKNHLKNPPKFRLVEKGYPETIFHHTEVKLNLTHWILWELNDSYPKKH